MLRGKLWRHVDFLKLWTGETVSEFGSQVTILAVPTVAILILHAGPFQVGLLSALEFLAFPTLGLVAGVYADRLRRRPIMIVCDIGRMLALGSIPVAFVLNLLTLEQLYLVALLTGIFTVFFDVSYQSYLPVLVDRPNLIEGNTKLEITRSTAQVAGPAVAGFLIQWIGGAKAVAVDAVSFLFSALALALIRKPEPEPRPSTASGATGFIPEMREGIEVVFRSPILWRIAGCTATSNLGSNMIFGAVFLVFAYRQLHLSAGVVGLIFAVTSVGGLAGALISARVARTLGIGPTLGLSIVIGGLAWLAVPIAAVAVPVPVLMVTGFVGGVTGPVYNIAQVSLRQAITPDRVQGRMNATMRTIVWGTIPLGAFIGGILGTSIGLVQTIVLGGIVSLLAALWIFLGPVIRLEGAAGTGAGVNRRLLIRDACLADGHSASLQIGVSLMIENGRIAWVRPNEEADAGGADTLDGGGATIVPAFVDAHSHLTMPGGSHWIERGSDPADRLRDVARRNAARLTQAGILWARDVGSPTGPDGLAISLHVRQELAAQASAPYIRVAGTWIATDGYLPMTVAVKDGDGLAAAAVAQLDAGTDFVKIMLDPPGRSDDRCPFTVDDVRKACEAVHRRGRKIAAHATILDGARVGAEAGVDSIEHGMELDDAIAATMRANNVALVSTLSVLASWATFERTTRIERFTSEEGKRRLIARREGALAALKAARRAGVRIAAGSDFGGGSVRAGHLAWEVELLVEAGLEPHEALAAATWRGGELLGIDHAGRLRAGDPADLVLVHGDPLSDPRALWRVWAVFKAGERLA